MRWYERLTLAGYAALIWLAQPLLRRKLARRGVREPGYQEAVGERFGHYAHEAPVTAGAVWIHAVSLGEARAAAVLIAALRAQEPGLRFLLTHGTATGRAEGQLLLKPGDLQAWLPWDTPGAARRFLAHFRPAIGVFGETEVWPILLAQCRVHGVPTVLANARMSEISARKAARLGWLSRPAFAGFAAVLAQTARDAERLGALGAREPRVCGSVKYDARPDAELLARGRAWARHAGRPVVLLASSREGEEQAFFEEVWQQIVVGTPFDSTRKMMRSPWCLVVPRHPQRFDAVAAVAAAQGFEVSRRSTWGADGPAGVSEGDGSRPVVLLGDSLGEMPLYYGLAAVALLGGSFGGTGGQNLIEAAACGCPLILGPSTYNFADAAVHAIAHGAAERVSNVHQGVRLALQWLEDPQALRERGDRGEASVQPHRGAALAQAQAILALKPSSGGSQFPTTLRGYVV